MIQVSRATITHPVSVTRVRPGQLSPHQLLSQVSPTRVSQGQLHGDAPLPLAHHHGNQAAEVDVVHVVGHLPQGRSCCLLHTLI